MTTRLLGTLLVLSALASGPKHARGQQPGGINFQELFQSLDANDDRVITQGEVPQSARGAFDRLLKLADSDRDGRIDQQEYQAVLVRARESAFSALPRMAETFKAADTNGDGKIGRDEFTGLPAMFTRADTDGDGFLTLSETTRFRENAATGNLPGANQFGPRFRAMDRNNDAKLSREEFQGVPGNFDRIDADKDGFLTPTEVRKFFAANPPEVPKRQPPQGEKPSADKP